MGKDNSSKLYKDIAHAKYKAGKYEEAIIACKKSREIDPKDSYPVYLEGCIHFDQKNYLLGIKHFSQALQIIQLSSYYAMRGDCKFELKNFIDAQEDFTEAIAGDPEEEYNFYKRACCAFELENYENAIQDLNKSIALNPDFHDFRLRGECKFKLEDFKGAQEDFNKAIALGNKGTETYLLDYWSRAECKFELEDLNGALDDIKKLLEIYPDDKDLIERKDFFENIKGNV